MTERDRDALGLSFDMIDVDTLGAWAHMLERDGVLTNATVQDLRDRATRMRDLATRLEQAVKDIGVLRELARVNDVGEEHRLCH